MPENDIVSEIRRDYIEALLSDGKRGDGRGFEEPRTVEVEKGVITTAEGSARVRLGKTMVCVGVKAEVGRPYPDSPDKGVMTTNSELVPLASPSFDPGPPGPRAIELSRVVDRGIRESGCIDFKDLVIEHGDKVWSLFIDIHVLDHDGNLIDAAGLAAIAALEDTVIKASKYNLGADFKLPLKGLPVPVTLVKIGETLLVDPGLDEERIADAILTVATDDDGNVRAMQKGHSGSLTIEDVQRAVRLSQEVGRKLRENIG